MVRWLALGVVLVGIGVAAYFVFLRQVAPAPAVPRVALPADALVFDAPADADPSALACAGGDLIACRKRAEDLVAANPGARGLIEADKLFDKTCSAGDVEACRGWAGLYERFILAGYDIRQKHKAYEAACKHGDARSCTGYGYVADARLSSDARAALFLRGCDLGDGVGCLEVAHGSFAQELSRLGRAANVLLARGIELVDAACKHGDSRACDHFAFAYKSGRGVAKDRARARELSSRACELDKKAEGDCREVEALDSQLEQDVVKVMPKQLDERAIRTAVAQQRDAILRECERDGRALADCSIIKSMKAELSKRKRF